ncbi:MAG: RHS repeat protein [Chitinophagaceae bacterium]
MKTVLSTLLITFLTCTVYAQHYYNDLLTNADFMKKRELYRLNKVKAVQYYSFDNNNQPIQGFECEQTITNNFTLITTTTTAPLSGTTRNISTFNANGQLMQQTDTSEGNKSTLTYTYDAAGRITEVTSQSVSPGNYISGERHLWYYSQDGKPSKMLKIKNSQDTTYISFILDEQGNVAEEKPVYRGNQQPTTYYYYDDNHRLTDIVRYNARAKKLLPDYIFEYTEKGQTATMLVTAEGTGDYQKWYYTYDEKGLKSKDLCYSKTKVLIGKVEYKYQFLN